MQGEERRVINAPTETRDIQYTREFCERMVSCNGSVGSVNYVDVRQSMRNGGGPACLRLRGGMTPAERSGCHQPALMDEAAIDALQSVVRRTYRDRLVPTDLADVEFANECRIAREALLDVLELSELA
mgnify:CR=1 FL=1